MKANKIERKSPRSVVAVCAVALLALVAAGVAVGYNQLRAMWRKLSVVTDVTEQASCPDGAMVKGGTVLDRFGIRNGANLAEIDFDAKRAEILREIPNIREISVTRRLPNRVEIDVEERRPIVRMGVHGRTAATGRVADAEGVVFTCRRGTSMLPTIREKESAITPVGGRLAGRKLAALRLIETAGDVEFTALGILDADIAKQDFILATLGNYAQAKIAWDGMDAPTERNRPNLVMRLTQLLKAIQSNVGTDAKIWNATVPNRVYADIQEPIQ